jgi:Plasmid pRiA4b ORF-3-like protein
VVESDRPEAQIYQLRAVLRGISPLIWRRLLVRSDSTVARLHAVLQIAFGWDDEHLNRFEIRGREYAVYRDGGGMIGIDARVVRLCTLPVAIAAVEPTTAQHDGRVRNMPVPPLCRNRSLRCPIRQAPPGMHTALRTNSNAKTALLTFIARPGLVVSQPKLKSAERSLSGRSGSRAWSAGRGRFGLAEVAIVEKPMNSGVRCSA